MPWDHAVGFFFNFGTGPEFFFFWGSKGNGWEMGFEWGRGGPPLGGSQKVLVGGQAGRGSGKKRNRWCPYIVMFFYFYFLLSHV